MAENERLTSKIRINGHVYILPTENTYFGSGYAICNVPADIAEKNIEIPDYKLSEGGICSFTLVNGNTADNVSLNINGLGNIPIIY